MKQETKDKLHFAMLLLFVYWTIGFALWVFMMGLTSDNPSHDWSSIVWAPFVWPVLFINLMRALGGS